MKKFFALFIFVFSAAAFGQSGISQVGSAEVITEKTDLSDSSKYAVKAAGDESVARVLNDEFTRRGFNDPVRLSILIDVRRENNWNLNAIFKAHLDAKKRAHKHGSN